MPYSLDDEGFKHPEYDLDPDRMDSADYEHYHGCYSNVEAFYERERDQYEYEPVEEINYRDPRSGYEPIDELHEDDFEEYYDLVKAQSHENGWHLVDLITEMNKLSAENRRLQKQVNSLESSLPKKPTVISTRPIRPERQDIPF